MKPAEPSVAARPFDEDATANAIERLKPLVGEEQLQQVIAVMGETISQVTHSGPLPPARELAAYKDIDASFAERIVRMAEKEQERRHTLPGELMNREYRLKSRGQHYALAVTVVVLLFAGLLAALGDTDMAGKVALGTLVGLVSIFVTGRAVDAYSERNREAE